MNAGDQLDEIVDYALGFCPEYPTRVDWDDLLYRIEAVFDLDLGDSMTSPEIERIKKAVRKARREATQ